jgi:hypothetical protein
VNDISKNNIAMSTKNRHSKLSILENMKPKEREKYDWQERNGEDPFYQGLRGADERFIIKQDKNPVYAIWATTPTRRVYRNFKNPFNARLERSGFNVTIDKAISKSPSKYEDVNLLQIPEKSTSKVLASFRSE